MPGLQPLEPDANFVFCKITAPGVRAPELARRLYVRHGILIKDCASKSMPQADRFLRIASRTPEENGAWSMRSPHSFGAISRPGRVAVMSTQSPLSVTGRRSILGHFVDAANLLTLAGLACSIAVIAFALNAQYSAAGIGLVMAFVFDVIDGPVAHRAHGRTDDDRAFGANLDSLADMVAAGVALGVVLVSFGGFGAAYVPGALALGIAAAMRLSYSTCTVLTPPRPAIPGCRPIWPSSPLRRSCCWMDRCPRNFPGLALHHGGHVGGAHGQPVADPQTHRALVLRAHRPRVSGGRGACDASILLTSKVSGRPPEAHRASGSPQTPWHADIATGTFYWTDARA